MTPSAPFPRVWLWVLTATRKSTPTLPLIWRPVPYAPSPYRRPTGRTALVRTRAQAMLAVDRAAFVRPGDLPFAYEDRPLPIGSSRPSLPTFPNMFVSVIPHPAMSCRLHSRKIRT